VKRRAFITLLGGAAAAWPLPARAQQQAMPVIGYLSFPPIAASPHFLAAFRKGLDAEGFAEGQNLSIEFRSADGKAERLSELAADLVRRQVGVIAAPSPPSALAAKRATQTIPIVFTSGADPVQIGLVSSLNRPGGNVTGFYFLLPELVAKRLGLLHELLPQAKRIAILVNPINASDAETTLRQAAAAARELNLEIETFNASTMDQIEAALAALANRQPDALLIAPDPFFTGRAMQPVIAMAQKSLPVSTFNPADADAGYLMTYGPDITDSYRKAGGYVGRILKGEKPADLPVQAPTKYELVINLKTAKALGLDVPATLLARADEVIE
jgi:putative tryptophan/tyrosine transport system substrate-binding protein